MKDPTVSSPPPQLAGVTREWIELPARGGRSLRMHVVTAGQGPALLLLHGAPQTHLIWAPLISRYAEHFRVICPDLRGAGWTEAPDRGYDPASLRQDLKDLMTAYDLAQTLVVAHDWSAIIAFFLATDEPARVSRLVIVSIPDLFVQPNARVVGLMRQGWYNLILPVPFLGMALVRGGNQRLLRYLQTLTGRDFQHALPFADLDRELLRDRQRARALSRLYRHTIVPSLLGLITGRFRHRYLEVPTLQLMGADDPAATLMQMGRHVGRAAALESQLIAGAGHFLIDEAPDAVFERTMRFLLQEHSHPRQEQS